MNTPVAMVLEPYVSSHCLDRKTALGRIHLVSAGVVAVPKRGMRSGHFPAAAARTREARAESRDKWNRMVGLPALAGAMAIAPVAWAGHALLVWMNAL